MPSRAGYPVIYIALDAECIAPHFCLMLCAPVVLMHRRREGRMAFSARRVLRAADKDAATVVALTTAWLRRLAVSLRGRSV